MVEAVTEVVTDETQEQGTTVQEPEVGIQEDAPEVVTLPSDEVEFTMPDKFEGKSAEEIAKSYMELEKFKGANVPETETPAEKPEDAPKGNKYLEEYNAEGKLSDESYAELAEQGVTKKDVDDRLEFEQYKNQKQVDDLVSDIGGIEQYTAMNEWVVASMQQADVDVINQEMAKASAFGKKAILKDTYAKYKSSQGGEEEPSGDVVHTNQSQTVTTRGYASQHELQADMADKRYGTDRSYTQAVEAKLAKSKDFS